MSNLAMDPNSEVEWLRQQIAVFQRRLSLLDTASEARVPQPLTAEVPLSGVASPTASATPPPPTAGQRVPVAPPPPWADPMPTRPATDAFSSTERRSSMSLPGMEVLLKWSGLILLFLSALFLVSTAIQRGWIGPELQLVGAAAIGFALIAGGFVLGARRPGWDVPLMAMGVAVLAASATAGWEWLSLGSHEPWIVALFAVLALSIGLTTWLTRPGVAATGLATTLIGLSLIASSIAQFAVVAAGAIVLVEAASLWRRLSSLHVTTVVVGLLAFGAAAVAAGIQGGPVSLAVLVAGAVVTSTFWIMPLGFTLRPPLPSKSNIVWRPTIDRISASLPVAFGTAWVLSTGLEGAEAGFPFFAVGGLALASAGLIAVSNRFAMTVWVSQALGAVAAITIGWVVTFEGPALLAGLALQAAVLLMFVEFVADRWARLQAWAMALLAGMVAFVGMVDAIDSGRPVIDDLVHLGVVGLAALWAWLLLRRSDQNQLGRFMAGLAYAGAAFWPVSALIDVPQGQALISAAWALIGFGALGVGFARSSQRVAWVGFGTLSVVMVKLLTVDLAAVDTFFRVALFFVLGGAFLFASFRMGTAMQALTATSGEPEDPTRPVGPHDPGLF